VRTIDVSLIVELVLRKMKSEKVTIAKADMPRDGMPSLEAIWFNDADIVS
jgi:hypothetical protein